MIIEILEMFFGSSVIYFCMNGLIDTALVSFLIMMFLAFIREVSDE